MKRKNYFPISKEEIIENFNKNECLISLREMLENYEKGSDEEMEFCATVFSFIFHAVRHFYILRFQQESNDFIKLKNSEIIDKFYKNEIPNFFNIFTYTYEVVVHCICRDEKKDYACISLFRLNFSSKQYELAATFTAYDSKFTKIWNDDLLFHFWIDFRRTIHDSDFKDEEWNIKIKKIPGIEQLTTLERVHELKEKFPEFEAIKET